MTRPYDTIIDLPRHISDKHPQMSMHDRAAQFAPFAALSGYGAAIRETGRLTDRKLILTESQEAAINDRLCDLRMRVQSHPVVRITHFVPDAKKSGGAYEETVGAVQKIDEYAKAITLTDGTRIPFENITDLSEE